MSQAIVPRRVCPPAQQYATRSWLCDWRRPQDTRQTLPQLSCTRKPEALDGPLLPEKKNSKAQADSELCLNEVHDVPHVLHRRGLLVGQLDIEALLQGHHGLHNVQ